MPERWRGKRPLAKEGFDDKLAGNLNGSFPAERSPGSELRARFGPGTADEEATERKKIAR